MLTKYRPLLPDAALSDATDRLPHTGSLVPRVILRRLEMSASRLEQRQDSMPIESTVPAVKDERDAEDGDDDEETLLDAVQASRCAVVISSGERGSLRRETCRLEPVTMDTNNRDDSDNFIAYRLLPSVVKGHDNINDNTGIDNSNYTNPTNTGTVYDNSSEFDVRNNSDGVSPSDTRLRNIVIVLKKEVGPNCRGRRPRGGRKRRRQLLSGEGSESYVKVRRDENGSRLETKRDGLDVEVDEGCGEDGLLHAAAVRMKLKEDVDVVRRKPRTTDDEECQREKDAAVKEIADAELSRKGRQRKTGAKDGDSFGKGVPVGSSKMTADGLKTAGRLEDGGTDEDDKIAGRVVNRARGGESLLRTDEDGEIADVSMKGERLLRDIGDRVSLGRETDADKSKSPTREGGDGLLFRDEDEEKLLRESVVSDDQKAADENKTLFRDAVRCSKYVKTEKIIKASTGVDDKEAAPRCRDRMRNVSQRAHDRKHCPGESANEPCQEEQPDDDPGERLKNTQTSTRGRCSGPASQTKSLDKILIVKSPARRFRVVRVAGKGRGDKGQRRAGRKAAGGDGETDEVGDEKLPEILPPKRRRLQQSSRDAFTNESSVERFRREFPHHNWLATNESGERAATNEGDESDGERERTDKRVDKVTDEFGEDGRSLCREETAKAATTKGDHFRGVRGDKDGEGEMTGEAAGEGASEIRNADATNDDTEEELLEGNEIELETNKEDHKREAEDITQRKGTAVNGFRTPSAVEETEEENAEKGGVKMQGDGQNAENNKDDIENDRLKVKMDKNETDSDVEKITESVETDNAKIERADETAPKNERNVKDDKKLERDNTKIGTCETEIEKDDKIIDRDDQKYVKDAKIKKDNIKFETENGKNAKKIGKDDKKIEKDNKNIEIDNDHDSERNEKNKKDEGKCEKDKDKNLEIDPEKIKSSENIEKDVENINKDDERIEKDVEKIIKDVENIQKDVEIINKDVKNNQKDVEIMNKDVENIQKDVEIMNKDVKNNQKDVEIMNKDAEKVQKDVEIMNKDVEKVQKDVEIMNKDVENVQKDVEIMNNDVENTQNNVEIMNKDVENNQKDVEIMNKDIENVQKDVEIMNKDVGDIQKDVEIMNKDVENVQKDVEIMNKDVGDIQKDVEIMNYDVENVQKDVEVMNKDVGDIQKDVGIMNKENEKIEKDGKNHGKDAEKLKTNLDQLTFSDRKNVETQEAHQLRESGVEDPASKRLDNNDRSFPAFERTATNHGKAKEIEIRKRLGQDESSVREIFRTSRRPAASHDSHKATPTFPAWTLPSAYANYPFYANYKTPPRLPPPQPPLALPTTTSDSLFCLPPKPTMLVHDYRSPAPTQDVAPPRIHKRAPPPAHSQRPFESSGHITNRAQWDDIYKQFTIPANRMAGSRRSASAGGRSGNVAGFREGGSAGGFGEAGGFETAGGYKSVNRGHGLSSSAANTVSTGGQIDITNNTASTNIVVNNNKSSSTKWYTTPRPPSTQSVQQKPPQNATQASSIIDLASGDALRVQQAIAHRALSRKEGEQVDPLSMGVYPGGRSLVAPSGATITSNSEPLIYSSRLPQTATTIPNTPAQLFASGPSSEISVLNLSNKTGLTAETTGIANAHHFIQGLQRHLDTRPVSSTTWDPTIPSGAALPLDLSRPVRAPTRPQQQHDSAVDYSRRGDLAAGTTAANASVMPLFLSQYMYPMLNQKPKTKR